MGTCHNLPVFRFTWPGQNEKFACLDHAKLVQNISQALDFHLQFIALKTKEILENTCSYDQVEKVKS